MNRFNKKHVKKYLVRSILLFAILIFASLNFTSLTTLLAAGRKPITYLYYGQKLGEADILNFYNQGHNLSCVQEPTEYGIKNQTVDLFSCFNTQAEANQYAEKTKTRRDADVERFSQLNQQNQPQASIPSSMDTPRAALTSCNHYSYYANSGWVNFLFDLCNGQSNANHTGVWSIIKTGAVNDTILFCNTNFGGFNFTYNSSNFTFPACPFAAGGARSSKVK